MSDMMNEEEYVQRIQAFLKRYGNTIFSAVLVGIIAFVAVNYYQKNTFNKRVIQSSAYDSVQKFAQNAMQNPADQASYSQFMSEADSLVKANERDIFATYTSLLQAKIALDRGDYKKVEQSLRTATKAKDSALSQIAWLRLARIQLAQNQLDAALGSLENVKDDAFMASMLESKGDVLQLQQKTDAAKQSYEQAWKLMAERQELRPVLQQKLASLGVLPSEIKVDQLVKAS